MTTITTTREIAVQLATDLKTKMESKLASIPPYLSEAELKEVGERISRLNKAHPDYKAASARMQEHKMRADLEKGADYVRSMTEFFQASTGPIHLSLDDWRNLKEIKL